MFCVTIENKFLTKILEWEELGSVQVKAWIFLIVNHYENLAQRTFVCLEPIVLLFDLVL